MTSFLKLFGFDPNKLLRVLEPISPLKLIAYH